VIKGLPPHLFFLDIADMDTSSFQVNFDDFMKDTGIDAVFIPKFFRCDGCQLPDIVDNLADIVGNASSRVGSMGSFLEGYNVQFGFQSLCLGGSAHSCSVSPDDYQPFLYH
jgi:hypothetical protein